MNYKTGDKLEIINDDSFHALAIGSKVELVQIDTYSTMPLLCIDEDGIKYWMYHSDVKLLS